MPTQNADMSRSKKAHLYLALAEGARRRFENHHNVEWRINFGLWTFFVAGAALVATSSWLPTVGACIVGTLASFIVLYVYAFRWLPHSHNYREECTRSRYWWETYALTLLPEGENRFPRHLKPMVNWKKEPKNKARWREPSDEDWDPNPEDENEFSWGRRHVSHCMCMAVTVALTLLFLCALWDKWYHPPTLEKGSHVASAYRIG